MNKSEGVTILAILRANHFTISRSLKVLDNLLYVETRGTAFRPVNILNAQQYDLLHSVSSHESIKRFKVLGESFTTLETISSPTTSTNQQWSTITHPANPDWEEMKMSLDGFATDISFLQLCTDVPHLCSIQLYWRSLSDWSYSYVAFVWMYYTCMMLYLVESILLYCKLECMGFTRSLRSEIAQCSDWAPRTDYNLLLGVFKKSDICRGNLCLWCNTEQLLKYIYSETWPPHYSDHIWKIPTCFPCYCIDTSAFKWLPCQ